MDTEDETPLPPVPDVPSAAPVIPPPPPQHGRRGSRGSDPRVVLWPLALALGAALGVGAYQWIQGVEPTFDYWLALVVG